MPANTEREPPGLGYQDYLRLYGHQEAPSEGGGNQPMGQAQWDSMDVKSRYAEMVQFGQFDASPDQVAKFQAQFGAPPADWFGKGEGKWTPGDAKGMGYVLSLEPPKFAPGSVFDPSRSVQDPATGYWITEVANTRPDWIAKQQELSADSGFFHGDKWDVVKVAAVFAAAYLGAAYLGEAAAGGAGAGAGEGAATTGAFDVGGSTGFGGTVPLETTVPTGALETGATTVPATEVPVGTQPPAPVTTATPEPALTPGTQAPAPVSNATPTPGTGNGIIDGARNAANGVSDWYSRLSPGSRMVLNAGVSRGLQGLGAANAQREAQQAAEARDAQLREDRVRRTGVTDFGGAFTPRPAGIIDSRRTGG